MCLSDQDCQLLQEKLLPNYFVPSGRAGHSSCCYHDEILIWSGRDAYNLLPSEKSSTCFSDLWIFHPNTDNIFYLPFLPIISGSGVIESPIQRLHHSEKENTDDYEYTDDNTITNEISRYSGRGKRKRGPNEDTTVATAKPSLDNAGNDDVNDLESNNKHFNPRPCYYDAGDAKINARVQLIDSDGRWNFAKAISVKNDRVQFHYEGWSKRFNESISNSDLVHRGNTKNVVLYILTFASTLLGPR